MLKDHGIGTSPKRREDARFLTGGGRYTDDINLNGMAHVAFLRSDIAHRRIKGIDKSVARGDVTLAACVPHNYPLDEIEPGLEETAFYDPSNFVYPADDAYDANGQLLAGSFMDYAMSRLDDLPSYTIDHSCQTPCTHNSPGMKGCGEAGTIGSPPTMVNAMVDAIRRNGKAMTHIGMMLSVSRVGSAVQC